MEIKKGVLLIVMVLVFGFSIGCGLGFMASKAFIRSYTDACIEEYNKCKEYIYEKERFIPIHYEGMNLSWEPGNG